MSINEVAEQRIRKQIWIGLRSLSGDINNMLSRGREKGMVIEVKNVNNYLSIE